MGLVSTTILLVAGGAFLGVLLTPLHWNALGDGAFGGVGDMTSAFYAKRVAEAMVYELAAGELDRHRQLLASERPARAKAMRFRL